MLWVTLTCFDTLCPFPTCSGLAYVGSCADDPFMFNVTLLDSLAIQLLTYTTKLVFPVMLQKLLRAVGLFAGSIVLMRNFGDLMAI